MPSMTSSYDPPTKVFAVFAGSGHGASGLHNDEDQREHIGQEAAQDAAERDEPLHGTVGKVLPVTPGVIEQLFASDLAFLQDLYRRVNQEGHTRAAVSCPSCGSDFEVDVTGDGLGGS